MTTETDNRTICSDCPHSHSEGCYRGLSPIDCSDEEMEHISICPEGDGVGHAWSITQESFGRLSLECSWCGQLASAEGQSEGKFIDLTLRD